MRAIGRAAIAALNIATWAGIAIAQQELERTGGPYVPTPQIVVDQMLRMANVGPQDFVIDLGSGDGVIVLTAAQQHKARGFGVDIDPALVRQSNAAAKKLGVDDRVSFQVQDVFKTDLSRASVITLYLLPSMMMNLRPKIFLEARPGTRVV
jgi:methylase of polypeptide subunit release factors